MNDLLVAVASDDVAAVRACLDADRSLVSRSGFDADGNAVNDREAVPLSVALLFCKTPQVPLLLVQSGAPLSVAMLHRLVRREALASEDLLVAFMQALGGRDVALTATTEDDDDDNDDSEGWTVMHVCAAYGAPETWKILVGMGGKADVRAAKTGDTPLHAAAREGNVLLRRTIVQDHGISMRAAINANGLTPADLARMRAGLTPSLGRGDGFDLLTRREYEQRVGAERLGGAAIGNVSLGDVVALCASFAGDDNVGLELFEVGVISTGDESDAATSVVLQGYVLATSTHVEHRESLFRGLEVWFTQEHFLRVRSL